MRLCAVEGCGLRAAGLVCWVGWRVSVSGFEERGRFERGRESGGGGQRWAAVPMMFSVTLSLEPFCPVAFNCGHWLETAWRYQKEATSGICLDVSLTFSVRCFEGRPSGVGLAVSHPGHLVSASLCRILAVSACLPGLYTSQGLPRCIITASGCPLDPHTGQCLPQ
jgi:hypothetical protein